MTRIERLVRAVLRAAPAAFRERYAEEYASTLAERVAAAEREGRESRWLALREVGGALRAVARLRVGLEPEPGAMDPRERERGDSMLETTAEELRHAVRALGRNPGFTLAAVTVLALGIGATTAIFSAVNAFLFRPLPFTEAERLVTIYETNPEFGWTDATAAPANAMDWREQVDAFADLAVYRDLGVSDVSLHLEGEAVLVGGTTVSGNFFDVLGVRPALGRTMTWEESWAGNAVAVLSHDLWVERFGADPAVVGRTVPFGGDQTPVEIVGVMPEGFSFPTARTEMWYPYGWAPEARAQVSFRRAHYVRAVARLADDVTLQEADAQLQVVVARLQSEYPATNRIMGAGLMPLRDFLVKGVRTPLMVLLGAVSVLMLLACANVANLMLVRANGRVREVALKHALGAGRTRVARQPLVESVALALVGGAAGLALGWFGVRGIGRLTPLGIEGATELALDGRVIGFTLCIALASGVLFGLAPVLRSGAGEMQSLLRESGRGQSAGRGALRASRLLVAAEMALALLLVVGAGLMVRSSWLLQRVDPGFRVEGTLAIELSLPQSRYEGRDEVLAFWDRFTEALEARPGIERAGTVGWLPLAGTSWSSQFQAERWPAERVGLEILHRRADRGYFEALGIPLVRGRHFEPTDDPDGPFVVVVNETFADEHFPGEDPIGQRIAYDRTAAANPEGSTWYEIVGIVGDQHQETPGVPARAEVFENRDQDWSREVWVVMRTSSAPSSVLPTVRAALAELDPQIPIAEARTLLDVWSASMSRERFLLTLLTIFGVTALLLATVGVYGVTAQAARGRTQEIGIRIALGASAPDVVGMMVRQGAGVIALGLGVGLGASLLATRFLESFLFEIEPNDPATLAAVVALLTTVAVVASWVPARRASSADPVDSLRAE